MKFSLCIDALFRGQDPLRALEQVRELGFTALEFWGWWNKDTGALAEKAAALDLSCAALCTRFIPLTDPNQREAYLAGLRESIAVAKKLRCGTLISQAGNDTGAVRSFQHRSIVAGLKAAAPLLEEAGVVMVLEPLNGRVDHPGTYLEYSDEGFELLDEAASDHIKLLFDIYHQQLTEGDLIRRISARIGQIGHFHAAGAPGRHELDTGELCYRNIFEAIGALGYGGFIGVEYTPQGDPAEGLRRLRARVE
jgi:hydroxypyruvate isomerase